MSLDYTPVGSFWELVKLVYFQVLQSICQWFTAGKSKHAASPTSLVVQHCQVHSVDFWPMQSFKWTVWQGFRVGGMSSPYANTVTLLTLYRWVYIIEGIFSILIAVLVWFGLPTDPALHPCLTAEQQQMMKIRQHQTAAYMGSDEFKWEEVRIAFKDPKLYLSGGIQFCQDILLYGFSTFLPAILKSSGYDRLQSNLLTIPVYIVGAVIFIIAAVFSDRLMLRSPVSFDACLV